MTPGVRGCAAGRRSPVAGVGTRGGEGGDAWFTSHVGEGGRRRKGYLFPQGVGGVEGLRRSWMDDGRGELTSLFGDGGGESGRGR